MVESRESLRSEAGLADGINRCGCSHKQNHTMREDIQPIPLFHLRPEMRENSSF